MAVSESEKKMVACPDINFFDSSRWFDHSYTRICFGSIYLRNILARIMAKKEKIKVEKKKKRIPLPQKPPKIEKSIKVYDRKKEKEKLRKKRNKEE